LAKFETDFRDDFGGFCKNFNLVPQVDKLYAYRRMATPYGAPAIQDAQFYFYLCDDSAHVLDKQDLVLNLSENTEYVWLTVEEALKRY